MLIPPLTDTVIKEKHNLQSSLDDLQTRHDNLTRLNDQFNTRFDKLQSRLNDMTEQKDNLTRLNDQSETRYDDLQTRLDNLMEQRRIHCGQ